MSIIVIVILIYRRHNPIDSNVVRIGIRIVTF
jgi:hypothetical protein